MELSQDIYSQIRLLMSCLKHFLYIFSSNKYFYKPYEIHILTHP